MKAVTVKELKQELLTRSPKEVQELCLRLSRFKKENKELLAIVLGLGSMYNHGSPANVYVVDDPSAQTMVFKALRKIPKGNELIINYNSLTTGKSEKEKWFSTRKIDCID